MRREAVPQKKPRRRRREKTIAVEKSRSLPRPPGRPAGMTRSIEDQPAEAGLTLLVLTAAPGCCTQARLQCTGTDMAERQAAIDRDRLRHRNRRDQDDEKGDDDYVHAEINLTASQRCIQAVRPGLFLCVSKWSPLTKHLLAVHFFLAGCFAQCRGC